MGRGETCGLLVGVSMVLCGSGDYQVRYGERRFLIATSSQNLSELVKPPPPAKEQNVENTTHESGEVLGITEEEEKELAELMEDDI